jgi:hypothetical protein
MRSLNGSFLVVAALCANQLFAAVNFEDFYDLDDFSKHCGTHAVLVCLAERGLANIEAFEVVDELLDPDGDGKTTFARIVKCLDSYGIRATGYRGELSDISAGGVFILQIKLRGQPHFSYTQIDARSGEVAIYDPALGSKSLKVSLQDLAKVWSGYFIEINDSSVYVDDF